MRKQKLFMLLAMSLLFSVLSVTAQDVSRTGEGKFVRFADKIPNSYVVILKDSAVNGLNNKGELTEVATALTAKDGGIITDIYGAAINGFAVEMDEEQAILLSQDELVETVYEDAKAYLTTVQPNTNKGLDRTVQRLSMIVQPNATWGLDRIDQRPLPLNTTYTYSPTGSNVNVYVMDTGINYNHPEFGGRALPGYDFITPSTNGQDCNGHGTHVAGTIGGAKYGVAKNAKLYSLRVLNCSGGTSLSIILDAINWVNDNHVKPAVVNMSLTFGSSLPVITNAINNSTNRGITYVVEAGDYGANACGYSPASAPAAITVGASTPTDSKPGWSNFGQCVDIFAPGENITSAGFTSNPAVMSGTNTAVMSGTSMASAHVAGVAALYLQNNLAHYGGLVNGGIACSASTNKLTGIGTGSPNYLLYSWLTWEIVQIGSTWVYRC